MTAMQQQGAAAKAATYALAAAGTAEKNAALEAIANILTERQSEWLASTGAHPTALPMLDSGLWHTMVSVSFKMSSSAGERWMQWPSRVFSPKMPL